ncbi:MAG: hypothetical protein ACK5PG_02665 [Lysobacterales bacterium]
MPRPCARRWRASAPSWRPNPRPRTKPGAASTCSAPARRCRRWRALAHGELDELALSALAESLPLAQRRPLLDALEGFDFGRAAFEIDRLDGQLAALEDADR